jgi:hypothetical protein
MSATIAYAIMLFGAAVAVAGLALLFLRGHDAAESSFEIFGQKVRLTSTGLVVLIVGCGLVLMPLNLPIETRPDTVDPPATPEDGVGIYLPERIDGEEAEPNGTTREANRIVIDETYMGRLLNPEDVDFFVFTLPPDGPTKLKVQVRWLTVAERVMIEVLTAYGRKIERGWRSNWTDDTDEVGFFLEPDNAYYLTLRPGGADFPFVYELKVARAI